MTDDQIAQLNHHFGQQNVELAMIFISDSRDRNGLQVLIEPTYERVRTVLEAVHMEFLGMLSDPSKALL